MLFAAGASGALDLDFRGGRLDLAHVVSREFDFSRSRILFEAMQLSRSGDRHDPWLLRQEPGERDLRRRRLFSARRLQQVHQGLIGVRLLA